MYAVMQ